MSHDKSDRSKVMAMTAIPAGAASSTLYLFNPLTGQVYCKRDLGGELSLFGSGGGDGNLGARGDFDATWRHVVMMRGPIAPMMFPLTSLTILDLQTGTRISPKIPITVDPSAMVDWGFFPPGRSQLWVRVTGADHVLSIEPTTGESQAVDLTTVQPTEVSPDFDKHGNPVTGVEFTTVESDGETYTLAADKAGVVTAINTSRHEQIIPTMDHAGTGCYFDSQGALWHIDQLSPTSVRQARYGTATFPGVASCTTFGDDIVVWRTGPDANVQVARVSRSGTVSTLPPWPADGSLIN